MLRIAGWPFTFSSTRHWPSPVSAAPLASDFSVAGISGWNPLCLPFALVDVICSPFGTASEKAGLPPVLGGL